MVIWHDLECGGYTEDLPLWRELATAARGPILDVGAGTGRVALSLASAGHDVTALDIDAELLAALRERAGTIPVRTVVADARDFALDERFALILVPMQTVQLLGEHHDAFVGCAARHLNPGGVIAVALAHPPEYEGEVRPLPDMRERDGWLWSSQPVAIRRTPAGLLIERTRETVTPDGRRMSARDEIVLADTTARQLQEAGTRHGLRILPGRLIAETDDYVGSEVVMLGA